VSFYCDTSSARDHRYMVAGGILVRDDRQDAISHRIQRLKVEWGIRGEMKWRECKRSFRDRRAYKELLELLISLIREGDAEFHTLVAEFAKFEHKRYSRASRARSAHSIIPGLEHNLYEPPGSPETSAGKMLYQLALHRPVRYCGSVARLRIYPDFGNDSANLPKVP